MLKLNQENRFNVFLFILFLFNIASMVMMDLSHDEAYYWIYSRYLDVGYFDHPAMVGILIKIGTSLFGQNEFGVRILFNVMQIMTLRLIWDLVGKKHFLLFVLVMLSFPLIVGSGIIALPDTPLLFFGTLFIFLTKKYLKEDNYKLATFLALTIVGLLYSKFHGLILVFLTAFAYPNFFKRKTFWYIIVFVTIAMIPYVAWQIKHDWITLKFHFSGRKEKHFDLINVFDFISNQLLLTGTFASLLIYRLVFTSKIQDPFIKICRVNIIGLTAILLIMSFRNVIEANWSLMTFVFIMPVLWDRLEEKDENYIFKLKGLIFPSFLIMLVFRLALMLPEGYLTSLPRGLEVKGAKKFAKFIKEQSGAHKIVANNYQLAAKLGFYLQEEIPALHLTGRTSQFGLLRLEEKLSSDEKITYVTMDKIPGAIVYSNYYPNEVYILNGISINELRRILADEKIYGYKF